LDAKDRAAGRAVRKRALTGGIVVAVGRGDHSQQRGRLSVGDA
jgi:hypothetical protein